MSNPTTPAAAGIPDEADALSRLDSLTADLSAARASGNVAIAEASRLKGLLETETAAHNATKATLTTVTAERDALAKTDRDFNTRLASEVAKFGISRTAAPAAATASTSNAANKPASLTEQAIAWRLENVRR